jgi:hypothetical protein
MKHLWLISMVCVCVTGCTTGFWADAISRDHRNVYDAMFADTVSNNIKSESSGEQPWHAASWQEFWIKRCHQVYESPGMGAPHVQYIIDRRRAAGLPDIPELQKIIANNQQ